MEGRLEPVANNFKIQIGDDKPILKKDGSPNKWYIKRLRMMKGSQGRTAYRAVGLLQIALMVKDEVDRHNWANDKEGISSDLDLAMQAIGNVQTAFSLGQIDFGDMFEGVSEEARAGMTERFLYQIANYVLRGDDGGNELVRQNGQAIWNALQGNGNKEDENN